MVEEEEFYKAVDWLKTIQSILNAKTKIEMFKEDANPIEDLEEWLNSDGNIWDKISENRITKLKIPKGWDNLNYLFPDIDMPFSTISNKVVIDFVRYGKDLAFLIDYDKANSFITIYKTDIDTIRNYFGERFTLARHKTHKVILNKKLGFLDSESGEMTWGEVIHGKKYFKMIKE